MRTLVFGRALTIVVLVATMLAWAPAAAQNVDPLTLELASSRDLCTANTLTELSWTIAGGRSPYTLTIDGETVDANAESHRANCGAIPADPMGPVPGTTPAKTFRASITDSQATPVTVTADVQLELVEALPAPTGIEIASLSVVIGVTWTPKPAPAEGVSSQARFLPQGLFLVRHRLLDADSWTYELRAELRFPWWIVLLDEGDARADVRRAARSARGRDPGGAGLVCGDPGGHACAARGSDRDRHPQHGDRHLAAPTRCAQDLGCSSGCSRRTHTTARSQTLSRRPGSRAMRL